MHVQYFQYIPDEQVIAFYLLEIHVNFLESPGTLKACLKVAYNIPQRALPERKGSPQSFQKGSQHLGGVQV